LPELITDDPVLAALLPPSLGLGLLLAFGWGALWGSFLNVVIYRLPRGESLLRPGSHCPGCGKPVRWFDNVPLLSWLLLRARCRDCGSPISARYPLVEALGGLLSAAVWLRFVEFGAPDLLFETQLALYLAYFAFAAALLAVLFIDLDLQVVPDSITYTGMVVGVLLAWLLPQVEWWESLLGLGLGLGMILALRWGYLWLRGVEGMGTGDATLLGMIGAFLGYQSLLFVLFSGSILGLLAALVLGARRRLTGQGQHLYDPLSLQEGGEGAAGAGEPGEPPLPGQLADASLPLHRTAIAFGPYLCVAALVYLFVGEEITSLYLGGVTRLVLLVLGD